MAIKRELDPNCNMNEAEDKLRDHEVQTQDEQSLVHLRQTCRIFNLCLPLLS